MLNAERCILCHDNMVDVILSYQSHLNYRHHVQHPSNASANTTLYLYSLSLCALNNLKRQLALGTWHLQSVSWNISHFCRFQNWITNKCNMRFDNQISLKALAATPAIFLNGSKWETIKRCRVFNCFCLANVKLQIALKRKRWRCCYSYPLAYVVKGFHVKAGLSNNET